MQSVNNRPSRVLLVNPPPYQIIEPDYDTPNFPRTALAFLAGHLREHDMPVEVLDCKFDRLSYEDGLERIKKYNPTLVGFTAFTNEIKPAGHFAKLVKQYDPRITTLIGSVHVTALPEQTLREFPEFDYGVIGEGEVSLLELAGQLESDQPIKARGVCYLDESGKFITNGRSQTLEDQDGLKPAWDMFRPAKEYWIQSSRGCPFACNFCMNPGGRIVRPRTVETTLNEIEWLVENMKPKSVLFGDEIFTVKRDRAAEICRGLIKRGLHKKVSWWCQTHVSTIDEELARLMKEANCYTVGLGVETGDEEKLKNMGKGTSIPRIMKAVKIMKKVKLKFNTFIILGQPNETYESAKKTVDFAVKLNPTIPVFGLMVPYPGTKIAEMARKGEGGYTLLAHDWNDYNKQIGNAMALKGITRNQLERLQFTGYLKVFIYNYRFIDLAKFIYRYRKEGYSVFKKLLLSPIKTIHEKLFIKYKTPNAQK